MHKFASDSNLQAVVLAIPVATNQDSEFCATNRWPDLQVFLAFVVILRKFEGSRAREDVATRPDAFRGVVSRVHPVNSSIVILGINTFDVVISIVLIATETWFCARVRSLPLLSGAGEDRAAPWCWILNLDGRPRGEVNRAYMNIACILSAIDCPVNRILVHKGDSVAVGDTGESSDCAGDLAE